MTILLARDGTLHLSVAALDASTRGGRREGGRSMIPKNGRRFSEKDHAHRSFPSVGVVEALDVVLAEIAADLHFDQLERDFPRIGEPMHTADRNVDRLVLMHGAH